MSFAENLKSIRKNRRITKEQLVTYAVFAWFATNV